MKLSKKEQELITKLRAQEAKEKEANSPKLVGYAKEDLYSIDTETLEEIRDGQHGWYPSASDVKNLVDQIFNKEVEAGAEFVCYMEDGEEAWYDSVYGIEHMDAEWARQYLRDIKPVGRKSK